MKKLSIINKIIYIVNCIFLICLLFSYVSPYINPNTFWPIAFFGLLFPILYFINILFLTYWIIVFKKPIYINILILILGSNNIPNFLGFNTNNTSYDNSIKVLSYNVRLFNKYNWIKESNVKEKIFNFIKKEKADILCIQEFYAPNKIPKLNYSYKHIGKQHSRSQWHMAIYSKYPQINKKTVNIKGKKMNNTCIYSDILIDKDTVRVYNVHLASNWFKDSDYTFINNPKKNKLKDGIFNIIKRMKKSYVKRAEEVIAIKRHMKECSYPVIICGDFNDTPLSYAYNMLKDSNIDSFSNSGVGTGKSFVKIPTLRIDYIFHDSKFKSSNYKTYSKILSDHYAISCEIFIP